MIPSEEFRRHANECGQMAKFRGDAENSAAWNSIAERYLRCAQWYDSRLSLADRLMQLRMHKKKVAAPAEDLEP